MSTAARREDVQKRFPEHQHVVMWRNAAVGEVLCHGEVVGYKDDHRGRYCLIVQWQKPIEVLQSHYPDDVARYITR